VRVANLLPAMAIPNASAYELPKESTSATSVFIYLFILALFTSSPNVVVERLTHLLRIRKSRFQVFAQRPAFLTKISCVFPQSLQRNSGIAP
jgi:hypothetical protein